MRVWGFLPSLLEGAGDLVSWALIALLRTYLLSPLPLEVGVWHEVPYKCSVQCLRLGAYKVWPCGLWFLC